MSSGEVVPVDGRRARRDRNRDAVLDAVHELFVEDRALPTVESVAERAGVSLRSVYRYFPDTRELMTAALARRVAQADSLFELPGLGEGSFEERLDRFVAQRLDVYERAAPTIRAALALAPNAPAVAEQVEARKAHLRAQA
ncbi:MAG: helix-turn-helix transcriptional regulator, partial [Nocardioidaceae bacterium]|nr:helix-turn-helix transcriptional regulator [Nocardioidaceae bacterium]